LIAATLDARYFFESWSLPVNTGDNLPPVTYFHL
jgi:hypothetical protein